MNGLVLHWGANVAEMETVRAVPTPPATASWQPLPHGELYNQVHDTLESNGLHVVQEAHGLWRDG